MESFVEFQATEAVSAPASFLSLVEPVSRVLVKARGLSARRLDDHATLVVTKTVPGFDADVVSDLRSIVRDAAAGQLGELKFLAFEFAHEGFPLSVGADGFQDLVDELADLILAAPIIPIASIRANLAGADLEFAMACSAMIGEETARFSFAADPTVSLGVYGLLAMKIGFVRAERLMDEAEIISAAAMHDLLLMKDIAPAGTDPLDGFLARASRRHNSSYGIYRAQRISARAAHENLRA
jgi:enoyl-CoA hydratase/carnithine racemase